MKWPKLKRDHIGLTVKTLTILRNGFCEIPAGTICTVTYSRGGLHLLSDPCKLCGIRISITKVSYKNVELINNPKSIYSEIENAIESGKLTDLSDDDISVIC